MFLRVVNLSAKPIALKSGEQIAQIFFEQLTQEPEKTYDKIESASFNNEDQYRGLGKYKDEYTKEIRDTASKEQQKIEKMTDRIYANILTLMGIFVSIFSLIMVNFSNISNNGSISKQTILTINLSLGFVIALFMGLLLLFINKKPHGKMFSVVYACIMALTLICIIAFI
ncbi:MAG: hypothetical protein VZR02_05730 [Lachnospiraceae bacterium]|nr:hypothetical protein [Lachnospiraceae bacterium]